ncbi:hypothetical protein [Agromyces humatus]|uniref:Uncharacterized protein n=1 Tax=Agromyces humatus TaxID=279573 RepID=A0ABP4X8L0_9MICO
MSSSEFHVTLDLSDDDAYGALVNALTGYADEQRGYADDAQTPADADNHRDTAAVADALREEIERQLDDRGQS